MVRPRDRMAKVLRQYTLLPLALVLATCDESTTGPDVADQPSSGPALDEPQIYMHHAIMVIQEVRASQVSTGGTLGRAESEGRTGQPRETSDSMNLPVQPLPHSELSPSHLERFDDFLTFIGSRPSLWLELDDNVWLVVLYEIEPAASPRILLRLAQTHSYYGLCDSLL